MNYEILYIIPAKYSETEFEEINKKVPAILEEAGAKIERTDNWGKRKLAYQIKHFRYGYYTLIIFSAEAEVLEKITQKLNLNQDVIRFQIVKEIKQGARKAVTVDGDDYMVNKDEIKSKEKRRPSRRREEPKKAMPTGRQEEKLEEKTEEKKETKEVIKEEPKKEEKPKKKTEKKKAGIDKLDEKLDELLNDAL